MENVSSEEELQQLRDEGKISEAEYQELSDAMRKSIKADVVSSEDNKGGQVRTCGLAIASLILSILSLFTVFLTCIPAIICGHIAIQKIKKDPTIKGGGMALAGLIIGYTFLTFMMMMI